MPETLQQRVDIARIFFPPRWPMPHGEPKRTARDIKHMIRGMRWVWAEQSRPALVGVLRACERGLC